MKHSEDFDNAFRVMALLPEILRKERAYRKITQQEIAEQIQVSRSTIVLLEQGKGGNIQTVKKYLLALKDKDLKTYIATQRVRK